MSDASMKHIAELLGKAKRVFQRGLLHMLRYAAAGRPVMLNCHVRGKQILMIGNGAIVDNLTCYAPADGPAIQFETKAPAFLADENAQDAISVAARKTVENAFYD